MRIGIQTWGSEGDVRPFLALAAGLAANGHRVTVAATTDATDAYEEIAREHGFDLLTVGDETPATMSRDDLLAKGFEMGNPIKQAELVMRHGFDPFEQEMFAAARELCENNDLVIGHFFVYPLMIAAARADVPWVSVNIVHNCAPSRHIQPPGFPNLGSWFRPLGWTVVQRMLSRIFIPRVNRLAEQAGLPGFRNVMREVWASDLLNLFAVSPTICRTPPDWTPSNRVSGFLNLPGGDTQEPVQPELEAFLESGPPPVYLTFGSMMPEDEDCAAPTLDLWRQTVELVGRRAILQSPSAGGKITHEGEETLLLGRSPYGEVFPRCAVVVHHGGAGTTQTTLQAGCPSVVVAHMSDQFFWGDELRRLGVAGKRLTRKGLSAAKLAAGIRAVLDRPELATNAERLGTKIRREDGLAEAVRLIQNCFASRNRPSDQHPTSA